MQTSTHVYYIRDIVQCPRSYMSKYNEESQKLKVERIVSFFSVINPPAPDQSRHIIGGRETRNNGDDGKDIDKVGGREQGGTWHKHGLQIMRETKARQKEKGKSAKKVKPDRTGSK